MDKLDCVLNYFKGTRAYYLYQLGGYIENENGMEMDKSILYKQFILDKKNIFAAKISSILNLMMAIKEDLVDNKGELVYESKIFTTALVNCVEIIATKVEDGYKVSNYIFPDAETVVAIIRNKIAHGKYKLDFEHNRIIFIHKGIDIVVPLEKMLAFVVKSFQAAMRYRISCKYEKNVMYYVKPKGSRVKLIKDKNEIKKIIKNQYYLNFVVTSDRGWIIDLNSISKIDEFLDYFRKNGYPALKNRKYYELVEFLKKNGCSIKYEFKRLEDEEELNRIINYLEKAILDDNNLSYDLQINIIAKEVQKSIDPYYNTFSALSATVHNIMVLDGIKKINSVKKEDLAKYMEEKYAHEVLLGYEEFAMSVVSMFNSLFLYPFDDYYDILGEYRPVQIDDFDFSKLDLSMVNPSFIDINKMPLIDVEKKLNSIVKKEVQQVNTIMNQQSNLGKVLGNVTAENAINQGINASQSKVNNLFVEYMNAYNEFLIVKKDFDMNDLYYRNKAIIEGIRNSIAHGNYEIIRGSSLGDAIIIFNDIYEGELTFQLKISVFDLEEMINKNYEFILQYINGKINSNVNVRTR